MWLYKHSITVFLLSIFLLQLIFWNETRHMQPQWSNVPPAPKIGSASNSALGDNQLAYRAYAITMQNIGDTAGKVYPLTDLNYDMLGKWFQVLDSLDPKSNFMPMLVAYYFSATTDPKQLDPVIEYLRKVGIRDAEQGKKWRWLVNAIFFAKHKQKDDEKALEMSYDLAALVERDVKLPAWAKNMPSFIKLEQGDKQSAYEMTVRLLQEGVDDMHPNEVNFMVDYLCSRILEEKEASIHPLCQ